MTARRGQDWGERGPLPPDGVVCEDDRDVSLLLERADDGVVPPVGLTGGDLRRGLGGRRDTTALRSEDATRVTVDVGRALIDGRPHRFVAHCVARRVGWQGPFVVVMNTDHLGRWNVAPRAHPNDGALDVLEGSLSLSDRIEARRRLPSGTHVPHPDLRQRRITTGPGAAWDLAVGTRIWIDGQRVAGGRRLEITIEPDVVPVVV